MIFSNFQATLYPIVLVASFILSSHAAKLPHHFMLHRRFTFVAHAPPATWSKDSLEDYDQYHFRFLSIGCHKEKVTKSKFYETCCHPRMKSDKLENVPVQCHLDPKSMVSAHDYILKSTNYKGEMSSGQGVPVYVKQGSIEVLKPTEGRSPSDPPTPAQISELLQAQAKVQKLNEQLKTGSNQSSGSETSSTSSNVQNTNDEPKAEVKSTSSEPTSLIKVSTPNSNDSETKKSDTTQKSSQDTQKDTDDAASKKSTDDAASKKASDAASKKAADDAAASKKAADDAAASKKAADDAAAAKKSSDEKDSQETATKSHQVSPSSGLSGVSQVFGQDGDAKGTYFYQEGAAGACGHVNSDDTPLVALPSDMYEDGKHCGREVMIKNTANGKSVVAKVQDMCPGCPSSTSLDLSTGAYNALGSQATGVLPIEWGYVH